MKEIMDLVDRIDEEINDAEYYAKLAVECREKKPTKAETFFKIANEEIGHANMLHGLVVSTIEDYRKSDGDPPDIMLKLYDIEHKKYISHMATVKGLLGLYKEMK